MLNDEAGQHESREELNAVSAGWERAIVANDADAIGGFMASDWVIVSATGIATKDEFLDQIASGDVTHEAFHGDVMSVRQYGDTAIVTGRVVNNRTYKGRAFSADEWTTDIFVRSDGRWRCVHSHITSVDEGVASGSGETESSGQR